MLSISSSYITILDSPVDVKRSFISSIEVSLEIKLFTMIDVAELIDNEFLRQFEIKIDDNLAKIEYSLQDRKIFLTKLVIPEGITDENFRTEFLSAVFEQIDERNLSIVPTSPDIAKFVRRNRKYKRMLPVGLRI